MRTLRVRYSFVVTVPRGVREAVLFVAVCLMKVSVERYGDREGRAEQVKLFVCVIQHCALEVLCLSEDTSRRI